MKNGTSRRHKAAGRAGSQKGRLTSAGEGHSLRFMWHSTRWGHVLSGSEPLDLLCGAREINRLCARARMQMGKKGKLSSQVLALTTCGTGKARHDVLAKVGQRDGKVVHSNGAAVSEKMISAEDLDKPSKAAEAENSERTRLALQALASGKASSAHGALERAVADKKEPTYIKYTPSSAQASGATNRVIRMVEAPSDPMEPPKFKHKRVPRGPPSPPAPVMHSPPRKITLKDQQVVHAHPCGRAAGYELMLM